MSRHSQPKPSGGWAALVLAVVTALAGASVASNVAAGPGRVAVGWATLIGAALFLLQFRAERQSSLRLARIDHARRRDAMRLREEFAEAHHRARLAAERSYAAVARAEALAAEVARLSEVIRSTPLPTPSVQVLPVLHTASAVPAPVATTRPAAPVVESRPAPIVATPAPRPLAAAARKSFATSDAAGTTLDLPLVGSLRPTPNWTATDWPEPEATPERKPAAAATDKTTTRVDLRTREVPARLARGA